jgi:tRNA(Ile)-lysidine synthase
MSLTDTLRRTLQQHGLVPLNGTLVVGVSGGADSLALLHILHSLRELLGCELHAATLDHGLRGEAGAADARFVVETCAAWGIAVTAGYTDVHAVAAENKLGIEAAARLARYDFLARVAQDTNAAYVAVAHHADDQAETVLMHLLRGSGLQGLGGMSVRAALPNHPDVTLIRPLLNVTRAQIEAYCQEHSLVTREDATNADVTYARNRLRHEILPHLETINPQVPRVLAQLGDIAAVDNDYLETRLQQTVIAPHVSIANGRVHIPRDVFAKLHPALQRRCVGWAAAQLRETDADEVGYVNLVAAVDVALHGAQGARALLPGGLQLRVDYGVLVVERTDNRLATNIPLLSEDAEMAVLVPGDTPFSSGWTLTASLWPLETTLARLAIPEGSAVVLRTRREGDRFKPLGLAGHTRKVGRWMIDHKIPRMWRDRIPLLMVNGEIAAILTGEQWPIGETFAVRHAGERVVYLRFSPTNQ